MATRSTSDTDAAVEKLRQAVARQGQTPDTAWTDDLPDDELPEDANDTRAEFHRKPQRPKG